MQDSVATREDYLAVSHKLNIHLTIAPGKPMAGYLHKRNENTVFTGFVYDCQKLETTHMSFICWVNDKTVVPAVEVTWWAVRGVSYWPPSNEDASQGSVLSERSRYCTAWVRSYDIWKGSLRRQKTDGWLPGTAELDYKAHEEMCGMLNCLISSLWWWLHDYKLCQNLENCTQKRVNLSYVNCNQ